MKKLNLFIGPPAGPEKDCEAVEQFVNESGEKIVMGGTTISVFQRLLNCKAVIKLHTGSDSVPPYGGIAGMTAMEAAVTLKRFNDTFGQHYPYRNAVSVLRKKIFSSQEVKIYLGGAFNPANGISKDKIIMEFISNIKASGLTPEIVDYQELA